MKKFYVELRPQGQFIVLAHSPLGAVLVMLGRRPEQAWTHWACHQGCILQTDDLELIHARPVLCYLSEVERAQFMDRLRFDQIEELENR